MLRLRQLCVSLGPTRNIGGDNDRPNDDDDDDSVFI